MLDNGMSRVKLIITAGILFTVLILIINVEVEEVGLDEPGYTYIGSAMTGVLRVNAETGVSAPCVIGKGKKAHCLSWKK